jgi:hypothetical protein
MREGGLDALFFSIWGMRADRFAHGVDLIERASRPSDLSRHAPIKD